MSALHRSNVTPSGTADPLAGTAYRTRSFLGQGSMGLVVEAEHIALGTLVVAKLLHTNLEQQPDFVDRLRIEAQAMSRLRSKHLTRCTDLSVTPSGRPFLVLERLYGRTVADELKGRGALPVAEAIDIARQTLAGLCVVHEAGIVHRDIKPANLFLCNTSGSARLVKILDFGIAKVLATATETGGHAPAPLCFPTAEGVTIGTPSCLSPEQARGLSVDARTDVYAVGVLLHTLLTGRGPFDGIRDLINLMSAQVNIVPAPPSCGAPWPMPSALDAAVARALAKRPEDRFDSAAEFSAALAQVLTGGSSETSTIAATPQTGAAPVRFDTEILPRARPTGAAPVRFDTEILPRARPTRAAPVRFDTEIMPRRPARPHEGELPPSAPQGPPIPSPAAASLARGRLGGRRLEALVVMLGALAYAALGALAAWRWFHR